MRSLVLVPLLFACKKAPDPKVESAPTPLVGESCFGVDVAANEVACKIATECAPVIGVCGQCYRGINLANKEAVRGRVSTRNAAAACKHGSPPTPKIDCKEGRCAVVGFNTTPPADCVAQAAEIRRAINGSRECKIDDDCHLFEYGCPFGCVSPINKTRDLIPLSGKVSRYRKSCPACAQKCPGAGFEAVCEGGLCSARVRAE